MKKAMSQFILWTKAHPWKLVCTFLASVSIGILASQPGCGLWLLLEIPLGMVVGWFAVYDIKKLLILALLLVPGRVGSEEQAKTAGAVVAVIVVVGGGVATYYLVKFCQKHFAPPPDPSTNNAAAGDPAAGGIAGAYTYSSIGSCYVTPAAIEPTNGVVAIEGDRLLAIRNITDTVDRPAFFEGLAKAGIYVPDAGYWMTTSDCLAFWPGTVPTVSLCNATHVVVLERSTDGVAWAPILTNGLPDGMKMRFYDATGEMGLYRLISP